MDTLVRRSLFSFTSQNPTAFGMHLAAAAKEHPVYFDEGVGMPVVLRGADVFAALRDSETFSNRSFQIGLMKDALISLDGDDHTRTRRIYNAFFSPRAVARYEEKIVTPVAREVIDQLATKDRADLIDDFAIKMPIGVVSALFGLPIERIAENDMLVRQMIRCIMRPLDPVIMAEGWSAYNTMAAQLREIAAREITNPSDTLLGEIARVLVAEGLGTVEACERVVFALILGSYETTIWLLVNFMVALLAHPGVMDQLREDRSLVPPAIEESLRWCSSVIGTVRYVERDATICGETLPAGTVVYLSLYNSHYDEEKYPRPEVFDIKRKSTAMTFGAGPHYCVGAPLARMEARVGVSLLLERFPALRADPDVRPVFSTSPRGATAYGPDQLWALLR